MVGRSLLAVLLLLVAGCRQREAKVGALPRGGSPVVAPDGRSLAYEVPKTDGSSRVVIRRCDGSEVAVDASAPSSFHPCWAQDGSLYYACNTVTNTAYEKWTERIGGGGVVIRRWKDGVVRDVLTSERRDFLPFVTADGTRLYFSSTRWTKPKGTQSTAAHVGVADLDAEGNATNVRPFVTSTTHACGYMQFAVSPNGRFAVWGEMRDTMDGWRIFGAEMSAVERAVNVLPEDMTAYAPRWCGDSRRICFTGYRECDDGWQVYVADVFSGAVRKVCAGQNPCWTSDGRAVVYERDGLVRRAEVEPFRADDACEARAEPEQVVWRKGEPFAGERLAFGDERTFFARVKVALSDEDAMMPLLRAYYAESNQAFQLYRDKEWHFAFATRTAGNRFHWVRWMDRVPPDATVTVVGIRTAAATYLSIDGAWPVRMASYLGTLDLRHPERIELDKGVVSAEVGTGWPSDVPSVERKAVFK